MIDVDRVQKGRSRFYQPRGTTLLLPSVTTVLGIIDKPALVGWASRTTAESIRTNLTPMVGKVLTNEMLQEHVHVSKRYPSKVKADAGDFGTRMHEAIEQILNGREPTIAPDIAQAVDSFRLWWESVDLEIKFTELHLASIKHGYGGGTDVVAMNRKTLTPVICDWKSSNGIWDEMALQVSAYYHAYWEMTGDQPESAWIVRLGKDRPEFEARKVEDIDGAFKAFLAALELWRRMKDVDQVWGSVI